LPEGELRRLRQSIALALVPALALGAMVAVLAGTAGAAQARSPFDGRWLVVIRSPSKYCQESSSYTLRIRDGLVSYLGLAPLQVRGRVDREGKVLVRLSGAGQWAQAAGRLWKEGGTGIWRGRKQRRACEGQWWARRR
jgi:hypothetical protein